MRGRMRGEYLSKSAKLQENNLLSERRETGTGACFLAHGGRHASCNPY